MKKLLVVFLVLLLCFVFTLPVAAESEPTEPVQRDDLLVDNANLLTEREAATLLSVLQEQSDLAEADIVVVTMDTIGEKKPSAFADDYFDYNGYGRGEEYDGVLLLLVMDTRDWFISTTGKAIKSIDHETLFESFSDDISAGNYLTAFETYAKEAASKLAPPEFSFKSIPICLAIGFAVSFIITAVMKSKMKSVRKQENAKQYVRNDSMVIVQSQDRFLYRNVIRTAKPKETSSGSGSRVGSSGRSHGGGGGKF